MAFVLDDAKLRAVLAEQQAQVERRRAGQWLEQLGRAHQWLDEPEPARAAFLEAAELFEQKMAQTGREDASRQLEAGVCLLHAGEPAAAREWLERSLAGSYSELNTTALHYLLGDDAQAIAYGEALDDPGGKRDAIVALARGRRDGDPAAARQAREIMLPTLRSEKLAPGETSGPSWGGWDIVAESARLEAELEGRPAPSYREILALTGLRPAEERA